MKILLAVLLSVAPVFGQVRGNPDPSNAADFEIHVVQPGETLSQIAGEVLKDSKLWKQLWEQNAHIADPNRIYPNDKILIRPKKKIADAVPTPVAAPVAPVAPAAPVAVSVQVAPAQVPPPASRGAAVIRSTLTVPPAESVKAQDVILLTPPRRAPEVKNSDVYCSGFVRATTVPKDFKVTSTYQRDGAAVAAEGDYVRISRGSKGGVTVGSIYQVVRPTRRVDDPSRKGDAKNLGMHYLDIARIQVVQAQADSALALVIDNCEATEEGDVMIPFVRVDFPDLPHPRAFSSTMTTTGQIKGSVVKTKSAVAGAAAKYQLPATSPGSGGGVAEGGVVYINLGKGDGLKTGDLFIVYSGKTAIGEIVVLKIDEKASSALVTYSVDALFPGDRVERR